MAKDNPHQTGPDQLGRTDQFRRLIHQTINQGRTEAARAAAASVTGVFPPLVPGYEIREELGRGSFGVVYRAFDKRRGHEVALKMLQQIDAPALARFKQEFRSLTELVHPNLVSLHELVSDGQVWF